MTAHFIVDTEDNIMSADPTELRALADALEQGRTVEVFILDPLCEENYRPGTCHSLTKEELVIPVFEGFDADDDEDDEGATEGEDDEEDEGDYDYDEANDPAGSIHKRFSYPDKFCLHAMDNGELRHECDLPNNHTTRHMCACGIRFD